jgi:hypothetical protein
VPKSAPRFLDLDLDDQQQRYLLQAWMYSEAPALSSKPDEPALTHLRHLYQCEVEYETSALTVVGSATTQIQFTIPNLVIETTTSGEWDLPYFCGQATAIAAPIFPSDTPAPLLSDEEPESAYIENERVITFRPVHPSIRQAIHPASLRLSTEATRFIAQARGRRLRLEEDPELQSE